MVEGLVTASSRSGGRDWPFRQADVTHIRRRHSGAAPHVNIRPAFRRLLCLQGILMRGLVCAFAAALMTVSCPASADAWVVCDFDVQAVRIDSAERTLHVTLLNGRPGNADECPTAPGQMSFTPETADYQSELPRKHWPHAGQRALLRYRHLDAICKSRGPCRIQHYSVIPVQ